MFVAEYREDVRITIPAIAGCLTDSHQYLRKAAIELLARLVAQGMYYHRCLVGTLRHVCS